MSRLNQNHVMIDGKLYYDAANQPLYFVKLNVDCWGRIFDLLSLRDIVAMSQTCQRMYKIGAYYFQENFRGVSCELVGNKYVIDGFEFEKNDFLQSIDKLVITGQLSDVDYFSNVELYHSLTTLLLHETDLHENQMNAFKNLLKDIACIELYECKMYDGFFEILLEYCPQLKCLRIYGGDFESAKAASELFLHKHSNLKYLHYSLGSKPPRKIPLKEFLEQNPNMKCLEIDDEYMWKNRGSLITSNVHLECLVIRINSAKMTAVRLANLLKKLNEQSFYKALNLSIEWLPQSFDYQQFIDEIITLRSFESLCSQFHVNLCRLSQLKELRILGRDFEEDFQTLAVNLTQLERLYLSTTSTDHFLPFICNSKTLKTIYVEKLMGGDHLNGNIIDVFALDRERRKLKNGNKVSIGLSEEVIYLATKWDLENFIGLKPKLIEVVRGEKIENSFDIMNKYLN